MRAVIDSLPRPLGIGAEYSVYHAERDFADFPDVSQRNPQLTTFLSWTY